MFNKTEITSMLENLTAERLVVVWNVWAGEESPDEYLWADLDELAETLGDDAGTFARRVFYGDVRNWGDDGYYRLDGYANIEQVWEISKLPQISEIAEWLEQNQSYLAEYVLD